MVEDNGKERGLVGYWKLRGDCRDSSGYGNHGVNHGVDLSSGTFDGCGAYVEVPGSESLRLGSGDFSLSAWIYTEPEINDTVGDLIDGYDPDLRRGITLSIHSSAGGYQSQGTDRHLHFGIDNARSSGWQDCGRPSPTSNYVGNSMTVYNGHLYAANIGAGDPKDWCHVFRYEGGRDWADCGRLGKERTPGVLAMIVHDGDLYAVTGTYDWTRVRSGDYDPARVYRFEGGTRWQDLGCPGENRTINCIASYKGKLYVGGGPEKWSVSTLEESGWKTSKTFPMEGPRKCFPHAMRVHRGRLYTGFPSVYAFDGDEWRYAGVPSPPEDTLQTHSLAVYRGSLIAGTWPEAYVSRYLGGENWEVFGKVGEDGTEVNSLGVYNGKLYGGSIPRAEVCRYDGERLWTSLKRFYSPEGWEPVPPGPVGGHPTSADVNEWSRVTSLTVYDGKLFASIGSCTSSPLDAPPDVRGTVFSMEAGKNASYDGDLGSGWKQITALREGGRLKLYVGGTFVKESTAFDPSEYDLSTDRPLILGFGQTDYFTGRLSDVRLYHRALTHAEIGRLSEKNF